MDIVQNVKPPPTAPQVHGSTSKAAPDATAQLDYDAFLQLLVAQMQNQDPMEPMNSSDYVAQLATFSQVEKTIQTNDRISEVLTAVRLQQAEGIVGRTVSTSDGQVSGAVVAAKVAAGKVIAVLADGREIPIEAGVIVSGRVA
jgi:flagellar basal-body rod modification protein FlgD